MRVWTAFLLLSFLAGSRATKRGRREHVVLMLAGCVVTAGLFMFERFA